jgi:hypothetical protein
MEQDSQDFLPGAGITGFLHSPNGSFYKNPVYLQIPRSLLPAKIILCLQK